MTAASSPILFVATVALLPLVALGLLILAVRRRNSVVASAGDHPHQDVSCPGCGREMAPGYVLAGRGIHWRGAGEGPIGPFATILGALPNTISLSFRPRENRAWRCEACSILVVDHAALVSPTPLHPS